MPHRTASDSNREGMAVVFAEGAWRIELLPGDEHRAAAPGVPGAETDRCAGEAPVDPATAGGTPFTVGRTVSSRGGWASVDRRAVPPDRTPPGRPTHPATEKAEKVLSDGQSRPDVGAGTAFVAVTGSRRAGRRAP
ncbi:hypothetical protein GCM10027160_34260 [Streptomyces calidiresistens]